MPRWGIFKRLDLRKKEDQLKFLILITGITIALLLAFAGAIKVTMAPAFCRQCHVMAPEYVTWQSSSHVNTACTQCHSRPGFGNLMSYRISALVKMYRYFITGTYERPVAMSYKLDDQICTQCHSTNRGFTPSGDLIIPHDKHAARKVGCVECHSGVAHGNIAARQLRADDSTGQAWTQAWGRQQMVKDFTEPKMNTCLDCHIKRQVTQQCEACHSDISLPPDHKTRDWKVTHGHTAKGGLGYCNKCHSYSLEAKDVPGSNPVARYARGNVFCYDCHQKRPAGHTEDWLMVHKKDVKNDDLSGCLVCHNQPKPDPRDKAVPTYCAKCHGQQAAPQKAGSSGLGKVHPPGFRKIHPGIVKEKGATNEGCWNCHDTIHCSRCHLGKL